MSLQRRFLDPVYVAGCFLAIFLISACDTDDLPDLGFFADDHREDALESIQEREALRVITGHNPVSYFLYRGEPMGYEYEILMQLAYEMDVDLELILEQNVDRMFELLQEGEGDLIAYRLPISQYHNEQAVFTTPLQHTRQVLVQRVPGEDGEDLEWDDTIIENPYQLAGDTVHVLDEDHYTRRAEIIRQETGAEMDVIRISPGVTTSELVRRVAVGDIDYTILHENIAELEESLYGNVQAMPVLSISQRLAWAVRNDSPEFLTHVNSWLDDFQESDHYRQIHQRYFEDRLGFSNRMASPFISLVGDRISEYDDMIREQVEANEDLDWDWRLVAALIQQESRFNTYARSWAGAQGLMQLMEPTAREYGVQNLYDPEDNVRGGLEFLVWLESYWEERIPDEEERRKFVLASYNTGHGHVQDARRLAEAFDADPDVWEDVAYYLLRKATREYYEHEVVHYGYSRGSEPVAYVRTILNSYEHYQRLVGMDGEQMAEADASEAP